MRAIRRFVLNFVCFPTIGFCSNAMSRPPGLGRRRRGPYPGAPVTDLEDAGFQVYETGTAEAALERQETHPEIVAIVTDTDMPGSMDGLKHIEVVHQSRLNMAIMLTCGFLKVHKSSLPREIPFVSKPYDIRHVINHIRELISHLHGKDCFAQPFKS